MFFVRATVSGVWRGVDVFDTNGNKWGEKALIRSHEVGRWSVDGKPINVEPGLCVSFRDPSDAQWFLDQHNRASIVTVEPGSIVAFAEEADAENFVRARLGVSVPRQEIDEMIARANAAQKADTDPEAVAEPVVEKKKGRRK